MEITEELRNKMHKQTNLIMQISFVRAYLTQEWRDGRNDPDKKRRFQTIDIYFQRGLMTARFLEENIDPKTLDYELYLYFIEAYGEDSAKKLVDITNDGLKDNPETCEKIIETAVTLFKNYLSSPDEIEEIASKGLPELYKDESLIWKSQVSNFFRNIFK